MVKENVKVIYEKMAEQSSNLYEAFYDDETGEFVDDKSFNYKQKIAIGWNLWRSSMEILHLLKGNTKAQ